MTYVPSEIAMTFECVDAVNLPAMHGIKVLDFGHFIAGPLTARLFGDHGAHVTHIDPPVRG